MLRACARISAGTAVPGAATAGRARAHVATPMMNALRVVLICLASFCIYSISPACPAFAQEGSGAPASAEISETVEVVIYASDRNVARLAAEEDAIRLARQRVAAELEVVRVEEVSAFWSDGRYQAVMSVIFADASAVAPPEPVEDVVEGQSVRTNVSAWKRYVLVMAFAKDADGKPVEAAPDSTWKRQWSIPTVTGSSLFVSTYGDHTDSQASPVPAMREGTPSAFRAMAGRYGANAVALVDRDAGGATVTMWRSGIDPLSRRIVNDTADDAVLVAEMREEIDQTLGMVEAEVGIGTPERNVVQGVAIDAMRTLQNGSVQYRLTVPSRDYEQILGAAGLLVESLDDTGSGYAVIVTDTLANSGIPIDTRLRSAGAQVR